MLHMSAQCDEHRFGYCTNAKTCFNVHFGAILTERRVLLGRPIYLRPFLVITVQCQRKPSPLPLPELQQLALDFLATFFSRHLTEQQPSYICTRPEDFFHTQHKAPEHTWASPRPGRRVGTGVFPPALSPFYRVLLYWRPCACSYVGIYLGVLSRQTHSVGLCILKGRIIGEIMILAKKISATSFSHACVSQQPDTMV